MAQNGLKGGCVASLIMMCGVLFLINFVIEKATAAVNSIKNSISNTTIADVAGVGYDLVEKFADTVTKVTGFNGWIVLFVIFFMMVGSKILSKKA